MAQPVSTREVDAVRHDAIGHTAADAQYGPTPSGAGYEHTDAHVWIIVKFVLWLGAAAIVIHFGLGLLFRLFVSQRIENAGPRYPLTSSEVTKLPPEPRLQRFPREDVYNFRRGEEEFLNGYGWVNKGAQTVHIPIEDAMKFTVQRGLPTRTEPSTVTMPMPSDASGGR